MIGEAPNCYTTDTSTEKRVRKEREIERRSEKGERETGECEWRIKIDRDRDKKGANQRRE